MPTRIFTFFLVMLWFVPPLVTFFQLDSYSISTVCIILLFNIVYYAYNKTIIFSRFFLSILILTISFIFIHTIFTRLYFNVGYNLTRNLTSLLLLFIFLLGAFNLSRVLLQQEPSVIKKIFTRFFYFFIRIRASTAITDFSVANKGLMSISLISVAKRNKVERRTMISANLSSFTPFCPRVP